MEYIHISNTDRVLLEDKVRDNREHIDTILADRAMVNFIDKKDFKSFFEHIYPKDRAPFTALFILSGINFLDSLDSIFDLMFYNLSVSDIKLPSNIKYLGESCFRDSTIFKFESDCEYLLIGPTAFFDCSLLMHVRLKGISYINSYAFGRCRAMKSFKIDSLGENVSGKSYFGGHVFSGSSITKIDFGGSQKEWKDATKRGYQWRDGSSITLIKCADGDIHHTINL